MSEVSTDSRDAVPTGDRSAVVDLMRVLAMGCIVGIHALAPLHDLVPPPAAALTVQALLRWSVPFFFLLSGFLQGRRPAREWLNPGDRIARLAWVFMVWTILWRLQYFARRGLGAYGGWDLLRDLVLGTAMFHLWFLPVLILCTLATALLARLHRLLPIVVGTVGACVYLMLQTGVLGESLDGYDLYRTPLYWLLFYAGGILMGSARGAFRGLATLAVSGTCLAIGASFIVSPWMPIPTFAELLSGPLVRLASLRETIGAALMTAAMAVWLPRSAHRSPRWLSRLADLSLGVYLLHPPVLIVAQRAVGPITTPMAFALWATALGSSYVLASLLTSTALTAWLLEAPWRRVRQSLRRTPATCR